MTSNVSSAPVTDGLRLDWPAAMQARAVWLRRLQWQPGVRRTAVAGRHGGLRLATLQWLDALTRRPGLHANVVRRSMGIWSSCAMDWRALAQQQTDRGIGRDGGARDGAMGPAGQTVVQWHISERIVVQPGVMRYAATPALHVASPGAAASMAPTAKVVAASPDLAYAAHPAHHDAPEPTVQAAPPTPGDVLYDQAIRALSAVPQDQVHNVASTVVPAPLHFDLLRTRQVESSMATSARPGSRTDVVESAAPPTLARTPQSAPDFFALVQRKNAMRASQGRSHTDRSAMSWPDRDGPAQRVAASTLSGPSSEAGVARIGGASPAPGDMLYDQAIRALSPVPPKQARVAVATTAPPPLRFDLPRARQNDSMTAAPAAPGSHAQATDRRDGPEPTQQASAAATTNIADAPLRRGDIEYVAQRVMRIITREQRREREARGIN